MPLRYLYSDQLVAEGERNIFLANGRIFVRTGVIAQDADSVTYRLREVYDDRAGRPDQPSGNTAPVSNQVILHANLDDGAV